MISASDASFGISSRQAPQGETTAMAWSRVAGFTAAIAVGLVAFSIAETTKADTLGFHASGWEFASPEPASAGGNYNDGISFSTNHATFDVAAPGYDWDPSNPRTSDHQVALYDAVGNLIASANVTGSDPLDG